MHDNLSSYTPPPIGPLPPPVKPSLWSRLMTSRFFADMADELHQANTATIPLPPAPANLPKGLYLFGSVGCGKSFLMDLFYAHLPEKYKRGMDEGGYGSRRVHFHQFMMDVHKKGHRIKSESQYGAGAQDWIVMAAREIAEETRVLCFDEFQVRLSLFPSFFLAK
jgi:protein AFG1